MPPSHGCVRGCENSAAAALGKPNSWLAGQGDPGDPGAVLLRTTKQRRVCQVLSPICLNRNVGKKGDRGLE